MMKISIKREQSQAGLSFAERENRRSLAGGESNFRPQVKNKLFLLLALLLTAATGAWAQTETLLLTIESKNYTSFKSGNMTFDDKVTVTFSNPVYNDGDNWGWYGAAGESTLLTVAGADGYTITRVKFYSANGSAFDEEAPFEATVASTHAYVNGTDIGQYGVTKIEVYGYEGTAEPAPTGYTVSLADNVKDADKWTITPNEGLKEGDQVTLTYSGRLKVKGVKATSEAAAASVPDGALSGVFSVSDGKQVYFSKGNLRYASGAWSFFDNQYDYNTSHSADAWDKFGWSTSATTYGMNTSTNSSDYSGDFVDWGATMGTGWFTLTSAEWTYLFNTRSASTVGGTENGRYAKAKVNNVGGIILFPDTYPHPDGVTAPTGVNATGNTGWNGNSYTVADWTKMESAGCVFLPAAGLREETEVSSAGTSGYYWSATPEGTGWAYYVYFDSGFLNPASDDGGFNGCSVRLVREAATSDEEPAGPTYTLLSAATTADCGKVVCAAGHLHDAKTAVPDGCTAVGILGKVTETGHGLILALKNATNQTWNTINGWTSTTDYAGTTLKVLPDDGARSTNLTSYTALGATAVSNWAVAQKGDYQAIFTNLGSTRNSGGMTYDNNVNAYITTGVGGTAMSGTYWSATEDDDYDAWYFLASYWDNDYKTYTYYVRPVLGF